MVQVKVFVQLEHFDSEQNIVYLDLSYVHIILLFTWKPFGRDWYAEKAVKCVAWGVILIW